MNNITKNYCPHICLFIIRGLGFRATIIEKIASHDQEQNFTKYLWVEVGYSFNMYIPIPNKVGIFVQKKNRKLIIFGTNKQLVTTFSNKIYKLRKPSAYTGRGIRIKRETYNLKIGKVDKR